MQSLAILIPIALILVLLILCLFLWAVRSDQYEDLDKSASEILFDEDFPLNSNREEGAPDTDSAKTSRELDSDEEPRGS